MHLCCGMYSRSYPRRTWCRTTTGRAQSWNASSESRKPIPSVWRWCTRASRLCTKSYKRKSARYEISITITCDCISFLSFSSGLFDDCLGPSTNYVALTMTHIPRFVQTMLSSPVPLCIGHRFPPEPRLSDICVFLSCQSHSKCIHLEYVRQYIGER